MKTITEVRARLSDRMEQQAALSRQLNHSLAIQAFEPRAFDGPGKCSIGGSSNAHRPWDGTITFKLADGTVKTHKAIDVPFRLWPEPMQAEYLAIPRRGKPKVRTE